LDKMIRVELAKKIGQFLGVTVNVIPDVGHCLMLGLKADQNLKTIFEVAGIEKPEHFKEDDEDDSGGFRPASQIAYHHRF
jgi:hypothetical protein